MTRPAPLPRTLILPRTISLPLLAVAALAALAPLPARAQWINALTADSGRTPKIFALAIQEGKVFAGFESGVYRSSDQGRHWTQMNNGLGTFPVAFCFAAEGPVLYLGTTNRGVFKSADQGESWSAAGLPDEYINALAASGGRLYAGTCCHGLRISADGGTTWRDAGIDTGYVSAVHAQGGTVFAGTGNGYFRSFDHGGTWERMHIGPGAADSASGPIAASGGALYAVTRGGLYRSLDGGGHWTRDGYGGGPVSALAADSGGLYAGGWDGLFHSPDGDAAWQKVDSGIGDPRITCLAIGGGELFAGVLGQGVWRRPLAEMGVTALGKAERKAVGARIGGRAFLSGNAMGFSLGDQRGPRAGRDARGARARSNPPPP